MLDFIYMLGINNGQALCDEMAPILRLIGIVIFAIKVVVPIILIVVGMLDLAKAVTEKNEDNIKKAQQALIKKAIAAVLVFLVVTIVNLIMSLVGNKDYKACTDCLDNPWQCNAGSENIGD